MKLFKRTRRTIWRGQMGIFKERTISRHSRLLEALPSPEIGAYVARNTFVPAN